MIKKTIKNSDKVDRGYNVESMKFLNPVQAVRRRPGMYVGGIDNQAYHHLLWEIVDNAIDEFMTGFGKKIIIKIDKDAISVEDFGRGFPVEVHSKYGLNGIELSLTKKHSGAKFENNSYAYSSGLNGIGMFCVNCLCESMSVVVHKTSFIYRQNFSKGYATDKLTKTDNDSKKRTGTTVSFTIDRQIMQDAGELNYDLLRDKLRLLSHIRSGIHIVLDFNGKKTTFKNGSVEQLLNGLSKQKQFVLSNAINLKIMNVKLNKKNDKFMNYKVIFNYVNAFDEQYCTFVNGIVTKHHGSHLTLFKNTLYKLIKKLFFKHKLAESDTSVYRMGVRAVIICEIDEPVFSGQTKERFSTNISKDLRTVLYDNMYQTLLNNQQLLKQVKRKILFNYKWYLKQSELTLIQKNDYDKQSVFSMSDKFFDCYNKAVEQRELFIVEGDSAAGTAKQGRDNMSQAILSLKGKPLNIIKNSTQKVLANQEIKDLIGLLNNKNKQFGKIIIMSDSDPDGNHIDVLLLTFLCYYFVDRIESSNVFMSCPPKASVVVYKNYQKNVLKYCYTFQEIRGAKRDLLNNKDKRAFIQYYKGLGEMESNQLWDSTLNPKTRKLKKITLSHLERDIMDKRVDLNSIKGIIRENLNLILGKNIDFRKKILKSLNIDLT